MKRLELRDTAEFRRGREFEQIMARALIERGHHVVRCYDLDVDGRHKAPMSDGPWANYRLPDLQAFVAGRMEWVECKEKGGPSYTYSEGGEDHGIGLRCYRDYRAIERLSGARVWLAIGERVTGRVLLQTLWRLGTPREYHGSKMDPGGMAFWPRSRFRDWTRYNRGSGQLYLPLAGGPFSGFKQLHQEAAE